jgi:hypothetical protein
MWGELTVQAFFEKLYLSDDDTVRSDLAEPFAILLGEELAQEAMPPSPKKPRTRHPTTGRRVQPAPQTPAPSMSRVRIRRFWWCDHLSDHSSGAGAENQRRVLTLTRWPMLARAVASSFRRWTLCRLTRTSLTT